MDKQQHCNYASLSNSNGSSFCSKGVNSPRRHNIDFDRIEFTSNNTRLMDKITESHANFDRIEFTSNKSMFSVIRNKKVKVQSYETVLFFTNAKPSSSPKILKKTKPAPKRNYHLSDCPSPQAKNETNVQDHPSKLCSKPNTVSYQVSSSVLETKPTIRTMLSIKELLDQSPTPVQ